MIEYLGGKCARCGTTEALQIDHIDPKTKSFDISKNWARAWNLLVLELDKCQALCPEHHLEKSRLNKELRGGQNKWTEIQHGTVWAYSKYRCRCEECRAAKRVAREKRLRDVAQVGLEHRVWDAGVARSIRVIPTTVR